MAYTIEDVRKKLGEELKIFRDGDSKYVVEKLIKHCETDQELLNAIMLPHKSYDKAFQYFFERSKTVGYKMPQGNLVFLNNDAAVQLSIEYFKTEKKQVIKKKGASRSKGKEKSSGLTTTENFQETKPKNNGIDGQISIFDITEAMS